MFNESYKQVLKYINHDNWYLPVDMYSGNTLYSWTDSLSAFWPGLQVMVGDIDQAIEAYSKFLSLWNKYSAVPERFDVLRGVSIRGINNYPLRPEFIESTYLLYRATNDPQYLTIGKNIFQSLQSCRVKCGYASISDVESFNLEDRMDSYFLSETCKYLYLLFDSDNFVNKENYLFTTEGHILPLNLHWHKNTTDTVRDICLSDHYKTPQCKSQYTQNYNMEFGGMTPVLTQEKCFIRVNRNNKKIKDETKTINLSKEPYIKNIVENTLQTLFITFLIFNIFTCLCV